MLLSVPNLISDTLESRPNLRAVSHEPQSDFSPMSRDDKNTFTWSGALNASPTGHTAGVADRDGMLPPRLPLTLLARPQLPARARRTAGRCGAAVEPSQSPQPAQTTRTVAIKNAALKSAVTALRSQRTLRHAVLVRERSHDHTSCIRTGPDCSRPQLHSGRRFTRLGLLIRRAECAVRDIFNS